MYMITRLQMFMQTHISMNMTKVIEPKQKFFSSIKSYNKYYTLDILYIFVYLVYSVNFL